jgi:hypothetical protein
MNKNDQKVSENVSNSQDSEILKKEILLQIENLFLGLCELAEIKRDIDTMKHEIKSSKLSEDEKKEYFQTLLDYSKELSIPVLPVFTKIDSLMTEIYKTNVKKSDLPKSFLHPNRMNILLGKEKI